MPYAPNRNLPAANLRSPWDLSCRWTEKFGACRRQKRLTARRTRLRPRAVPRHTEPACSQHPVLGNETFLPFLGCDLSAGLATHSARRCQQRRAKMLVLRDGVAGAKHSAI